MRRIILFVVIAILCMSGTGYSKEWTSRRLHNNFPLPSGYERCAWGGATDFTYYRDTLIPRLWYARKATDYTINAALGLLIGGYIFGEAAAQQIGTGLVISYLGNASTDITGWAIDSVLGYGGATSSSLSEQAARLSNELGISDHYVFGAVDCGWKAVVPLGAVVNLKVMPDQDRKPLLRIMRPEIDMARFNARVFERDLDGQYQYTTIKKVFGYEVLNGRQIRGPNNQLWPLPVVPDTPQRGGRVTGKIMLGYFPDIGYGGIREINLVSPVNKGPILPYRADAIPAIVLNRDTVNVDVSNSFLIEAGKDLNFKVHIKGFHSGVASRPGQSYPGFANQRMLTAAVFEGISCRGAGVTRTSFQQSPDNLFTAVWCNPATAGHVELVMKTLDGDVKIADAIVSEPKKPTPPNAWVKGPQPYTPPQPQRPQLFEAEKKEMDNTIRKSWDRWSKNICEPSKKIQYCNFHPNRAVSDLLSRLNARPPTREHLDEMNRLFICYDSCIMMMPIQMVGTCTDDCGKKQIKPTGGTGFGR